MASLMMDSSKINKALSHVGINDATVRCRRNCFLQLECYHTVCGLGKNDVIYFGSQSEGSTTIGINSDIDIVVIKKEIVVVTNTSDNVSDDIYTLQLDKFTQQGYCLIKDISHKRKHFPFKPNSTYVMSSNVLDYLQPTNVEKDYLQITKKDGPALYSKSDDSGHSMNVVLNAYYCTSWPLEVTNAFKLNQTKRFWPSGRLLQNVLQSRCFVVPKGSDGPDSDIEWRLSFSFAERLLMFDLNIFQIRCYILMKYVKSSVLDNLPDCKGVISSYICKTVLFHIVSQSVEEDWVEEELLNNFSKCLHRLQHFIDKENCPHFIMPMNNLLANKLGGNRRKQLSNELQRIIESKGFVLLDIKVDNFCELLRSEKVNWKVSDDKRIRSQLFLFLIDNYGLTTIEFVNSSFIKVLHSASEYKAYSPSLYQESIGVGLDDPKNIDKSNNVISIQLKENFKQLKQFCESIPLTDVMKHEATKVWEGIYSSFIGSLQASAEIKFKHKISDDTLQWLHQGMKCTDVASAHLKLACIVFLVEDLEQANTLLDDIREKFYGRQVLHICTCKIRDCYLSEDIPPLIISTDQCFVYMIRNTMASCVVYLSSEINSCPKELQYEMFRVVFNKKPKGNFGPISHWYSASVPQVPYLFFLQYKLYKQLGRIQESKQALRRLSLVVLSSNECPSHKDTVCNLIGQCYELEGDYELALKYYFFSLQIDPVYNAAKILICCNLFKQLLLWHAICTIISLTIFLTVKPIV